MATQAPDPGVDFEEVEELEGVEGYDMLCEQIEQYFSAFLFTLRKREAQLLAKVRKMKELYQKHLDLDRAIEQLEEMKRAVDNILTENLIADDKGEVENLTDHRIRKLKKEKANLDSVHELKLVFGAQGMAQGFNQIHLRCRDTNEFSKRQEPIVMTISRGMVDGKIGSPADVALDKARNLVYLIDASSCQVSVFSLAGDSIKSFGKGKVANPYGITLTEKYVFVTDRGSFVVSKFLRSGEFVYDTSHSIDAPYFQDITTLCANNESLYVCNRGKDKIDLFDYNLVYKRSFGEDILDYPQDIKVHTDKIFVFLPISEKILVFSTELQFIYFIPITTQNYNSFGFHFFTIDQNENFVITDGLSGCLHIFSRTGDYINTLGGGHLFLPMGVAVDSYNRIFAFSRSYFNIFQVY